MRTEGIRFFASSGNLNLVGILGKLLRQLKDVPRMMLRLRQASASVNDWQNLMASFHALDQIRFTVEQQMQSDEMPRILTLVLESFSDKLHNFHTLLESVIDFQESKLQRRLVVLEGVDADLDEEKRCYEGLGDFLEEVARSELEDLDMPDLRISVVFFPQIGYLVAVPNGQANSDLGIAAHFSTDEYIYYKTERMAQLDEELGDISSKISDREFAIVDEVRLKLLTYNEDILESCRAAAMLDCVLGLTVAAVERDWVEPQLVKEPVLYIQQGRHPLCELCVDTFVSSSLRCVRDLPRFNACMLQHCGTRHQQPARDRGARSHDSLGQVPNDTIMDFEKSRPGALLQIRVLSWNLGLMQLHH